RGCAERFHRVIEPAPHRLDSRDRSRGHNRTRRIGEGRVSLYATGQSALHVQSDSRHRGPFLAFFGEEPHAADRHESQLGSLPVTAYWRNRYPPRITLVSRA